MLRRILTLICFISFLSSYAFSETIEAQTIATVNFAGGPDYYIGFSSTQVTPRSPEPDDITNVEFKLNSNGERITNPFYIYWRIYTTEKITIKITELKHMSNSSLNIPILSTNAIGTTQLSSGNTISSITVYTDSSNSNERRIPRIGSQILELRLNISESLANSIARSSVRTYTSTITISSTVG